MQDRIIPCIYAFLPDKTEDTYRRLFKEVRSTVTTYETENLISNYRRLLKNGIYNRKKNVYLIALPQEFREMVLIYFDLPFYIQRNTHINVYLNFVLVFFPRVELKPKLNLVCVGHPE